jgi:hypothetical protein
MRANAQQIAKGNKASKATFKVVGKEAQPIKGLNIGGLAAAPSRKSKDHPVMPVSQESLDLLAQFLQIEPKFKELEKQSKALKAQIAPSIKADYFRQFAGSACDDSTQIAMVNGERVRLVFGTRYTTTCLDARPLIAAVGTDLAPQMFREATTLTFELDKVADDKQQPFIDGVIALAQKLGISQGITAKQCVQPTAGFHEARLRLLTPEQNVAVDLALPFTAYPKLEVVK